MKLDAASRRGAFVPALPIPYPRLEQAGLRIRPGQVSLTVAGPGVGKSQLWLNIVTRTGIRAAYWSADTDQHDVLVRTMALLSGFTTTEIDERTQDPSWKEYLESLLARAAHVEWAFDNSITARVLAERVNAIAEVRRQYPRIIVVDNLSNVVQNQGDELAEQKAFIVDCQSIARDSGAHVAILAHAEGQYDIGTKPIPLPGVLNKLGKIPEVVITLHRAGEELGVNVVKNRGGVSDPSASRPFTVPIDFSRATVHGFEVAA